MRHRSLHVATLVSFVAASAMVVIAVPSSTMPPLSGSVVVSPDMRTAGLIRRKAYEDTVLKKCHEMASAGIDVQCPDINDPAALRAFLKDMPMADTGSLKPAAPMMIEATGALLPTKPTLELADISDRERGLLRWYQKVGACPETLDTIVDGLYNLCVSFIGDKGQGGQAQQILNQLTPPPQSAFPVWSLNDFIKAGARPQGR